MSDTATPVVHLRVSQLQRHAKRLGLTTSDELADHLGISRWTVNRMLSGAIDPGVRTIAHALTAFPDLTFEDLFEVVEDEPVAQAS